MIVSKPVLKIRCGARYVGCESGGHDLTGWCKVGWAADAGDNDRRWSRTQRQAVSAEQYSAMTQSRVQLVV